MILNHRRDPAVKAYEGDSKCPECERDLLAKCGQLIVHHWAHKIASPDCNYQPKSEWHMQWQMQFPLDWLERKYSTGRADVLLPNGDAVEFQSKGLEQEVLQTRINGIRPGRIAWVVDGREAVEKERLILFSKDYDPDSGHGRKYYSSFRWKKMPVWFLDHVEILIVDIGNGQMFDIRKIYSGPPSRGWGFIRGHDTLVSRCLEYGSLSFAWPVSVDKTKPLTQAEMHIQAIREEQTI